METCNLPVSAIHHRLQLTEVSRQQIEEELSIVNKEKAEIIEQFQHVRCEFVLNVHMEMFLL